VVEIESGPAWFGRAAARYAGASGVTFLALFTALAALDGTEGEYFFLGMIVGGLLLFVWVVLPSLIGLALLAPFRARNRLRPLALALCLPAGCLALGSLPPWLPVGVAAFQILFVSLLLPRPHRED